MPELPEVETVRRVLAPHLLNKKITDVALHNVQVIASPLPEQFAERMRGQIISDFTRRGKFLRLCFASGDFLTIHLRMTGCLTVEPRLTPAEKHTHIVFSLNGGNELRYEDVRRLGKMYFTPKGGSDESGAEKLGVEPFDGALTAAYLRSNCEKSPSSPCCSTRALLPASAISIRTKSCLPRISAPTGPAMRFWAKNLNG